MVTYDISHSKITTQVSTWVTAVLVGMWSGHSTCTKVVRVNFKDFLTPAALYLSDTVIYFK